jgi:hypothetical protein
MWPADLAPVVTSKLPAAGSLVVHARALPAFQDEALAGSAGGAPLPNAVLFLPAGATEPPDAWLFFDAVVREPDWDALRLALSCPRRPAMAELADELPAAFLSGLRQPIAELPLAHLPLPPAGRDHLATCAACRQAFDAAVDSRLRWRRRLCPPPADLAAHAGGATDEAIARHLATCAACQAEVAALQPQPAPPVVRVPLVPLSQDVLETIAGLSRQWAAALGMLVNGCLGAGLVPAGARTRHRSPAGQRDTSTLSHLLAEMAHGQPLLLVSADQELFFAWDAAGQSLHVEMVSPGDGAAVETLQATLRLGDRVLWAAPGITGAGVDIPLSALQAALENGAGTLEFASR